MYSLVKKVKFCSNYLKMDGKYSINVLVSL